MQKKAAGTFSFPRPWIIPAYTRSLPTKNTEMSPGPV